MIDWTSVEEMHLKEWFLLFPNEPIYNEGIRLSCKDNAFRFELIKAKRAVESEGSIAYEYEPSIFYNNPIEIFKSIGYQESQPVKKNVTFYKCLKYGLEVLVYESEGMENVQLQAKTAYLEVRETSERTPVTDEASFWKIIKTSFGDDLVKV